MASVHHKNYSCYELLTHPTGRASVNPMVILKALKKGWERSGLTYKKFGDLVGVSMSSAHKKLNGDQVLTLEDAEVWAKILKVKISAKLK